jgi:uncharacterized membrane protein HdeD (DUF308 family)
MENEEVREVVGMLAKYWWIELLIGIIWILVSLIVLQFDSASVTTIGVIIGVLFVIAGVQQFFLSYVAEGWKWLWIVFGFVFVIAGIVALAYPKNTFAAVADMLGFLFFLVGIFWIIESLVTKESNELWWLSLTSGILMIVLSFWTAGQFFITKAYTLLVFAGIWLLMHGIFDIIRAFQLKKLGKIVAG